MYNNNNNNNNRKFTLLINVLLNNKMQNRILDTVLQEVGQFKQKTLDIRQKSLKIIFNRDYFEKV